MFRMPSADLVEAHQREMQRRAELGGLADRARAGHSIGRLTSLLALIRHSPSRREGSGVTESFEPVLRAVASTSAKRQVAPSRLEGARCSAPGRASAGGLGATPDETRLDPAGDQSSGAGYFLAEPHKAQCRVDEGEQVRSLCDRLSSWLPGPVAG